MSLVVIVVPSSVRMMVVVRCDTLLWLRFEGEFVLPKGLKLLEVLFLDSLGREGMVQGVNHVLDHTFLKALGLLLGGNLRSCGHFFKINYKSIAYLYFPVEHS
jgi:hypothetical protein